MTPGLFPRLRLLGAEVHAVTPADLMAAISDAVPLEGTTVVANHNAHSLYLFHRCPEMRAFFQEADLIEVDSTPLIAWARLLGRPLSRGHRSTYLEWREDFWRLADDHGWRVFYLGGAPGVAQEACARLSARWPRVRLASRHGYFDRAPDSAENQTVLAQINAFDPDVLLVGMGMPRQEIWILENRSALKRGVIFSIGAAFDYEAGVQPVPPRWAGRIGLEWLFRLLREPSRLGFRYLVEPWYLVGPALADLFGGVLAGAKDRDLPGEAAPPRL